MTYFDTYFSNTLAPSNNQKFFRASAQTPETARSYYKLTAGGKYRYSFLFANSVASTFSDGAESFANYVCKEWEILGLKVCICKENFTPSAFSPVTFDGNAKKTVRSGEIFSTDPILLEANAGDTLCLEICYAGEEIPYIHETLIRGEKLTENGFEESLFLPRPIMIGCDRPVKQKIVFLGDSITEGIGTPHESYAGYAAVAAKRYGNEYAFWNIGLGYGRAADAASGGLWFYEAKQGDLVFICFGVNDVLQGYTEGEIKKNLTLLVRRLKASGCRVCLQTVPPFDMTGEKRTVWENVNAYLRETLSQEADFFFDNAPILCGEAPNDNVAIHGGHPDENGCRLWGDALAAAIPLLP